MLLGTQEWLAAGTKVLWGAQEVPALLLSLLFLSICFILTLWTDFLYSYSYSTWWNVASLLKNAAGGLS